MAKHEFEEETCIEQRASAHFDGQARPVAAFYECTSDIPAAALLVGEWTGLVPQQVKGLEAEETDAAFHPWELCLRATLRPFFPSRAGGAGQIQARRYIRLSALGRGRFPSNAPSSSDLRVVLEHAGFNTGGRTEHLYAPWASINGAPQSAMTLRTEMLTFLRDGTCSTAINDMLVELKRFWV